MIMFRIRIRFSTVTQYRLYDVFIQTTMMLK